MRKTALLLARVSLQLQQRTCCILPVQLDGLRGTQCFGFVISLTEREHTQAARAILSACKSPVTGVRIRKAHQQGKHARRLKGLHVGWQRLTENK